MNSVAIALADAGVDPGLAPRSVASDADGKIADSYHLKIDPEEHGFKDTRGVEVGHGFAERTTFIVSPDGMIAETIGGLAPATNVDRALAAVQRLAAAGQPARSSHRRALGFCVTDIVRSPSQHQRPASSGAFWIPYALC